MDRIILRRPGDSGRGFKPHPWALQRRFTAPEWRWTREGLVAHYATWEGAGTILRDISGNNNHVTLTGGPLWIASNRGLAISLDGIDDHAEIADGPPSLDITGEITVLAWINVANNPVGTREGVVSKYRSQSGNMNQRAYVIDLRTNGKISGTVSSNGTFGEGTTSNSVNGLIDVADGTWRQVGMTYIPSTSIKVFVDGREDGSNTTSIVSSIFNSPAPLWLGLTFDSTVADRYLDGLIDDVWIWNRALPQARIMQLFKDPFGPIRMDLGLLFAQLSQIGLPFAMVGGNPDTWQDELGNTSNAELINSIDEGEPFSAADFVESPA